MKAIEKIQLIDKVARTLQERMTFADIKTYLTALKIDLSKGTDSYNSKYVYSKDLLAPISEDTLILIANELKIEHNFHFDDKIVPIEPSFWKPGHFKLFISHLATFKTTVSSLKKKLEMYGISGFVAHEDIEPALQWQDEIERGLFTMDAMCAILMPEFNLSKWTDQEIGVAIGRGILVIPIRKGLDPYGFIGKFQGFQAEGKSIHEVATAIFNILSSNIKTKNILIAKLSELFLLSNSLEDAQIKLKAIRLIKDLSKSHIEVLATRIKDNQMLKNDSILKEFNQLIANYGFSPITKKYFETYPIYLEEEDLPF